MAGAVEPQGFHEKPVLARGNKGPLRVDGSGSTVVSGSGLARFGEAVLKGSMYGATSRTLTIGASGGNLVGSSAAADTNTCLFNPSNSSAYLVLLRVGLSVQSGTLAAGGVYHGLGSGQTIATSISGAARGTSTLAGSGALSAGYVFTQGTQATLTGGAAPTTVGLFAGTTAAAVTTGLVNPITDEVDGYIVLPPGGQYQPLFTAVGTTIIFNVSYVWLEVPTAAV